MTQDVLPGCPELEPIPDAVIIDRAMHGVRVPANPVEQRMVIDRWEADLRSLRELERIQGWNASRRKADA